MANTLIITDAGLALIADLLVSGDPLVFTRIEAGTGADPGAPYNGRTALVSPLQDLTGLTWNISDSNITIIAELNNTGFVSPVSLTEIGVYAQSGAGEILYGIAPMYSAPDWIPAFALIPSRSVYTLQVEISSSVAVEMFFVNTGFLTKAQGDTWYAKLADFVAHLANFALHLADKTPHAELVDRTLTVGASGKNFTMPQAAADSLKKYVPRGVTITINADAGTYAQDVLFYGFYGGGTIVLNGGTSATDSVNYAVNSITVSHCFVNMTVTGFRATTTGSFTNGFSARANLYVKFDKCSCIATAAQARGVQAWENGYAVVSNCLFSNRWIAESAVGYGKILSTTNTGTGNTIGLEAADGGKICKNSTQPAGTTAESESTGGDIA